MNSIAANLRKAWETYDPSILTEILSEDVEYFSMSKQVFLGGKSKVIAHLHNTFSRMKDKQVMTEIIPDLSVENSFVAIHRYIEIVPELSYMIFKQKIFNVVTLELRETEIRVDITFEFTESKIDLIFIDNINKKRTKVF